MSKDIWRCDECENIFKKDVNNLKSRCPNCKSSRVRYAGQTAE